MKINKKESLNRDQIVLIVIWGALGGVLVAFLVNFFNYNLFPIIVISCVFGLVGWIVVRPKLKALNKSTQMET